MGTRMKDFRLPLYSRSVFSRIGVVTVRKLIVAPSSQSLSEKELYVMTMENKIRRLFVTSDVLLVTFSWFFRGGFSVAFSWPSSAQKKKKKKQCLGIFRGFSWPSCWANFTRTRPQKVF